MNVFAALFLLLADVGTIATVGIDTDNYGRKRITIYGTKQLDPESNGKFNFVDVLSGNGTLTQITKAALTYNLIVIDHSGFKGTIDYPSLEAKNIKLRFIEDLPLKMIQKSDGIYLDFADGIKPTDFPEEYQPRLLSSDDLKLPFTDLGLFNPARPLPLPNPPSRAIFFKLEYGNNEE